MMPYFKTTHNPPLKKIYIFFILLLLVLIFFNRFSCIFLLKKCFSSCSECKKKKFSLTKHFLCVSCVISSFPSSRSTNAWIHFGRTSVKTRSNSSWTWTAKCCASTASGTTRGACSATRGTSSCSTTWPTTPWSCGRCSPRTRAETSWPSSCTAANFPRWEAPRLEDGKRKGNVYKFSGAVRNV